VGPADHLTAVGVDVVLDQPGVGSNLSDHPAVEHAWGTTEPVSLLQASTAAAIEEYDTRRSGPRSSNSAEASLFAPAGPDGSLPNIQIHAVPLAITDDGAEHGMWLAPTLLNAVARGTVRIASADSTQKPEVRCNYWFDDVDTERMMAGIELTLDIANHGALARYCATPLVTPASRDRRSLRDHIARRTMSLFHAAGTCAMGTVVDAELRVIGLDGLRVVDASVMPEVPRGNPNAVVIAIAERAADVIRNRETLRSPAELVTEVAM
jgi:choline dehydrogenase